ncbi:prolyl oligopeptidase family serine peptidase [bacterium]|nr:prolyl oligopeptidase family serine peptidase [bacterium]
MLAMQRLGDPQVSHDEELVVFTVRETDLEANRGRSDLWLVEPDGENLRPLTRSDASEWNPRWCMNGDVHFLTTRSGSAQIWSISPHGGEAVQMTDTPLDIQAFEHAPALGGFLIAMEVYPGLSPEETVARDEEKEADPRTGMIYDELMFRHWDTWEDGKRSHLFVLDPKTGELTDLMPDVDADVPTFPWGGMHEVAVAPDGSEVLFTAKILPGSEFAWSTDWDIYAVKTDGSGEMRCLTEANEAWDTTPEFSPDGDQLVWKAMDRPGFEADRYHLERRTWPGLEELDDVYLDHEGLKLSCGAPLFDADGETVYMTTAYLGQTSIFAVDLDDADARLVVRDGGNGSLRWADGRLLYLKDHLRSPRELYTVEPSGKDEERITGINDEALAKTLMGEPEQFTFTGWNGETVYAYVVKPYDWTEEKAAAGHEWPIAFLVHGGPQGSFGNDFHYRWNPQAYVGAGFTTVAVDFHGSVGYGQDFTDSISGHWGDRPLEDLEKGLAAALERYEWMDGDRVVAAGASYGGYMINWMHGQPFAENFKAFVCHDGNLCEQMAYYDTEELWFPEWEHGRPWEDPEAFQKHNPINHVANWHVPTLVVHGALDYRVVDTQGMSTFTALRRRGVPARFLYFPDENHWVLQPHNSIQWHEEVMGWLTRWIEE